MKPLLIQQASGEYYEPMLEMTRPIHKKYCAQHGYNYWCLFGDLMSDRSLHWNKISLIDRALNNGFQFVIWLDADCLIVDPKVNLLDGMPSVGDIGMVVHRLIPEHFNSGAIYLKNTSPDTVGRFFYNVWNAHDPRHFNPWKGQSHWNDQSDGWKAQDKLNLMQKAINLQFRSN